MDGVAKIDHIWTTYSRIAKMIEGVFRWRGKWLPIRCQTCEAKLNAAN
jgi:hypothetical protein